MAWSTRELADLAGTTVNTVRHYHQLGLLAEPERRVNGYKQYGVPHLVALLRVRRLVELGVPLGQIQLLQEGGEGSQEALHEVDAQLEERIAQLQQAREDIAAIVAEDAPAHAPRGFERVAARLSEADRSMIHISSKLYDSEALDDLRQMVAADIESEAERAFEALPADAPEAERIRLGDALAPSLAQHLTDYPWLQDPAGRLAKDERISQATFVEAVVTLYNEAQVEVLARAGVAARALLEARGTPLPPLAGAASPESEGGEAAGEAAGREADSRAHDCTEHDGTEHDGTAAS